MSGLDDFQTAFSLEYVHNLGVTARILAYNVEVVGCDNFATPNSLKSHAGRKLKCHELSDSTARWGLRSVGAQCDCADPLDHGQNSPFLFPCAVCSRHFSTTRFSLCSASDGQ